MCLIWGVQKSARPGQGHMINWMAELIRDIKSRGLRIIITAPTLGEYLAGFNDDDALQQLTAIQQDFIVQPYDAPAAALAARLYRGAKDVGILTELTTIDGYSRQSIKTDLQIIAASVVGKATVLYSHGAEFTKFKKLAKGTIIVKDIPDPEKEQLFKTTHS